MEIVYQAGEDISAGDYVVIGDDGMAYRYKGNHPAAIILTTLMRDVKQNEWVAIDFLWHSPWHCPCGYTMPAALSFCTKCGRNKE